MLSVKKKWTNKDFLEMGWHDCRVYALRLLDESFSLTLDIDYIFGWIEEEGFFKFHVSPCTLKFFHVSNIRMNFEYGDNLLCFISDITRKNERFAPSGKIVEFDYKIECDIGYLEFTSTGFEQDVMEDPRLIDTQDLSRNYVVI